jgi:hypothetical protein
MKKTQGTKSRMVLVVLAAAALVLSVVPTETLAQTPSEICAQLAPDGDEDGDGFTNFQECEGLLPAVGAHITFFGLLNAPDLTDRASYLHPLERDLFVILVPEMPSNFPANPLEFVSRPQADGGLGITLHVITPADPEYQEVIAYDRAITYEIGTPLTPLQKAVRVTEDLHPEGIILGYANQGTPNGLDEAIIYTEHIKSHVNFVYGDPALVPEGLIDTYIKHTIAHEIGHMTSLAVEYNRRFGGYHYKSGSEVIMEQAVKYTDKGGNITFYISTEYAAPSQQGFRLE